MKPIKLSPVVIIGTGLIGASVGCALSAAGERVHLSDLVGSHAMVAASRGAGRRARAMPPGAAAPGMPRRDGLLLSPRAPAGMLREPNLKMRPCPGVWRVRLAGLRTFHTAAGERARRSTNRRVEP